MLVLEAGVRQSVTITETGSSTVIGTDMCKALLHAQYRRVTIKMPIKMQAQSQTGKQLITNKQGECKHNYSGLASLCCGGFVKMHNSMNEWLSSSMGV